VTEVALLKHRDPHDETKPYVLLLKTAERTNLAQSGLLGEGMPNHRSVYEVLPGPRELAAGADHLDLRLQTTGANGQKIVQTLTFHRGSYVIDVAYDVTNNGRADRAVRVLPA
jgi:YidC/Oxa1 family membrane protein insertase